MATTNYLDVTIDMTADYVSGWVTVDDYDNLSTNGFIIQLNWVDYATTGDNATVNVYGSIGGANKALITTTAETITGADNDDDVLIIHVKNQYSKVQVDYTSADCSAGSMKIIARQARR